MENGRYEVSWPWRPGQKELPNNEVQMNKELAYGRFKTFERRFEKDKRFAKKYQEIMSQQLTDGIVEKSVVNDKAL